MSAFSRHVPMGSCRECGHDRTVPTRDGTGRLECRNCGRRFALGEGR